MRSIKTALLVAVVLSIGAPAFAKHHGAGHAEAHAAKKKADDKKTKAEDMMPKASEAPAKIEQAPAAPSAPEHHAE